MKDVADWYTVGFNQTWRREAEDGWRKHARVRRSWNIARLMRFVHTGGLGIRNSDAKVGGGEKNRRGRLMHDKNLPVF